MAKAYFILQIFNEEPAIPSVLASISSCDLPPHYERRILAVNDASTDGSLAALQKATQFYPVEILNYETNQGLPKSFRGAFEYLKPYLEDDDIVFLMEADGTSDIACIPLLTKEIEKGADVSIASRHAPGSASPGFPFYRRWGSAAVNLFLRIMWNVPHVKDYTIFYRAYRGSILRKYLADFPPFVARKSFAVNGEVLLQLSRFTSRFAEVPFIYNYGLKKGKSKMKLFQTLWEYLRITPRRPLHKQPIFWVAVGAFLARVWGITYGFPDLLVLDEPALTRGALTMLKLHTLIPAFHPADFATMYYPPLTAYLYLVVLAPVVGISYLLSHLSLSDFASQLVLDPTVPWIATRAVSALVGALTVYSIGRLAEKIYPGSGIFAALFLATSFLHMTFSHIARHWSLSYLLIVGMLWATYFIFYSGNKRWYVLAGVCAGLAAGNGLFPAVVGLVPALAHFLRPGTFSEKIRHLGIWIMGIIAVLLFALFMALHPLILQNMLSGEANQGVTLHAQKNLTGLAETFVSHIRGLGQSETMILLFALIGIPVLLRRHMRFGAVLIAGALSVIAMVYIGYYFLLHYISLSLPILVLFAGGGALWTVEMAKKRWAKVVIALCIFALPALITLRFSYLWTLPDTRHEARAYIEEHIPKNARIISNMPNMKVVWPSVDAIKKRLTFDPVSSRLVDTTLLSLPTEQYPSPAFDVFELGTISIDSRTRVTDEFLKSQRFEYAVLDRSATPIPALESLIAKGEVVARFPAEGPAINVIANEYEGPTLDVFAISRMGPEVLIVKLPQ